MPLYNPVIGGNSDIAVQNIVTADIDLTTLSSNVVVGTITLPAGMRFFPTNSTVECTDVNGYVPYDANYPDPMNPDPVFHLVVTDSAGIQVFAEQQPTTDTFGVIHGNYTGSTSTQQSMGSGDTIVASVLQTSHSTTHKVRFILSGYVA